VRRRDDKRADHRGELQATNAAERLARQAPRPFDARTHARARAYGVDDHLDRVDLVTGAATRLRVATRQQGQEARRCDVVPDADLADADSARSAGRGRGDAISSHQQGRVEARAMAIAFVLVTMRVRVVITVITRIVYVAGHRRRREGSRSACDFGVDYLDAIGRRSVGHVAVNADVHDH
jgi:hypothetical protein